MKWRAFGTLLALGGITMASAQTDFPGNPLVGPKKYTTRSVGGGADPGASLETPSEQQPAARYVTHIVLYDTRFWTSADGKPLSAKLIAFEDLVAEASKGGAEPKMPSPPARPTVIRNGRIRLLVEKKPVEIALERLSLQDREFVGQIEAAITKKAAKGR